MCLHTSCDLVFDIEVPTPFLLLPRSLYPCAQRVNVERVDAAL